MPDRATLATRGSLPRSIAAPLVVSPEGNRRLAPTPFVVIPEGSPRSAAPTPLVVIPEGNPRFERVPPPSPEAMEGHASTPTTKASSRPEREARSGETRSSGEPIPLPADATEASAITPTPRIAVAGVSGYAGAELARILLRHPRLRDAAPTFLGRMGEPADVQRLTDLHPQLTGLPHAIDLEITNWTWRDLERDGINTLLLATPHEQSRTWVPEALSRGIRIIDLSGAWRLHNPQNRAVYKLHDTDPQAADKLQAEAVYGSPELHAPAIAEARLVANPGCYATSIILALAPLLVGEQARAGLVDLDCGIVSDSKSGVSGAGKNPTATTHFMNAADNLSAYAVFGHRHTGELLEQLHLTPGQIQFTPHLLPIPRGILSTVYVRLTETRSPAEIQHTFDDFYASAPLVRVRPSPSLPQIQHVVRSPFCDLGFQLSPDGRRLVIISCLDNLLKGAASQAIQNLNLMCGWPQTEGLL